MEQKQLLSIVQSAMKLFNQEMGTEFSLENTHIAFFTPETGEKVFVDLCSEFFPDNLNDEYKQPDYFESFSAQALISEKENGILIREDLDLQPVEWRHVILHELSHIVCTRDEIEGGFFIKKYGNFYFDNTIEDGYINAGHAIWREFVAELFAVSIDDNTFPFTLRQARKEILYLNKFVRPRIDKSKVSLSNLLVYLFSSDEYFSSRDCDTFLEKIRKCKLEPILDLSEIIATVFDHVRKERMYEIDVDYILYLGSAYIRVLTMREFKTITE